MGARRTFGGGQHDLARFGASRVATYVAGEMIPSNATVTRSTTATYNANVADRVSAFLPGWSLSGSTVARSTTATYTASV